MHEPHSSPADRGSRDQTPELLSPSDQVDQQPEESTSEPISTSDQQFQAPPRVELPDLLDPQPWELTLEPLDPPVRQRRRSTSTPPSSPPDPEGRSPSPEVPGTSSPPRRRAQQKTTCDDQQKLMLLFGPMDWSKMDLTSDETQKENGNPQSGGGQHEEAKHQSKINTALYDMRRQDNVSQSGQSQHKGILTKLKGGMKRPAADSEAGSEEEGPKRKAPRRSALETLVKAAERAMERSARELRALAGDVAQRDRQIRETTGNRTDPDIPMQEPGEGQSHEGDK